jgi:VanZ family protein
MKSKLYYLPAIVWATLVLIACALPPSDVNEISFFSFPHMDKVAHFSFHFGLIFLILWGKDKQNKINNLPSIVYPSILVLLFGISIEFLQAYVFIGRSASVFDEMANTVGLIIGILFYKYLYIRILKIIKVKQ